MADNVDAKLEIRLIKSLSRDKTGIRKSLLKSNSLGNTWTYFMYLWVAAFIILALAGAGSAAKPVTYICCYNYTFSDGIQLRYNVTDWIAGTDSTIVPDTINHKEGLQGLKLIATNGRRAYMDLPVYNNFSGDNNFAIWAYADNASNQNGIWLYVTSNGSSNFSRGSNYFWDSEWHAVKTGWNKLVFNQNNFQQGSNTNLESWTNVMKRIRLVIKPNSGANLNVTFDDLRYNISGQRAKLIITFDDGDLSAYTKAFPILNANNQAGVSFVVTSRVGNELNMNISHLRALQNAGWDISSHTIDHPDLRAVNDSTLTSELNGSYDWLVSNNFQKSAGFLAYPYGYYNDHVIDYVKKRYILARAAQPESAQQHFTPSNSIPNDSIQYIQKVIRIFNTTSVQSVKDGINATINSKLLGILYLHDIVDTYPDCSLKSCKYKSLTTDLQSISDYIKSRSADVDVITYSDYVIPNINNFTPVINKTTRIYSNGSSVLITNNKYDEYMPNMIVIPSSDSIDIDITTYNETGGLVKFNESSPNSNLQVSYAIGDRIPNQIYSVKIYWANGTKYQDLNVLADANGYIKYNSTGFGDSRYQEIKTPQETSGVKKSPGFGVTELILALLIYLVRTSQKLKRIVEK